MPSTTNTTASSPRAACSTDTRQAAVTQSDSASKPEKSTEENHGMLPRFIYDTTSLQDRLIQTPIPDTSACSSTTAADPAAATIDAVPSPHPHDENEPKGNTNDRSKDKREEFITGNKL